MRPLPIWLTALLLFWGGSTRATGDLILSNEFSERFADESEKPDLEAARQAFLRKEYHQARKLLEKALSQAETLPHPELQLALWHFNANHTTMGKEIMEQLAITESHRADFLYTVAEMARDTNRLDKAWAHLSAAEQATPRARWSKKYVQHLNTLITQAKTRTAIEQAKYFLSAENNMQAEQWFQIAADVSNAGREAYLHWLLKNNRGRAAEKVAAVARQPSKQISYQRALALRMQGRHHESATHLNALRKADNENFHITNQLALTLAADSRMDEAMRLAEINRQQFPDGQEANVTFAWLLHLQGKSREAEPIIERTLATGHASRDTAYYLSEIKRAVGKIQEAQIFLNSAKESRGEFFNAYHVLSP